MENRRIPLSMWRDGFILNEDIKGPTGAMLARKGNSFTASVRRVLLEINTAYVQVQGNFTPEELSTIDNIPAIDPYIEAFTEEYKENLVHIHLMMDDLYQGNSLKMDRVEEIITGFKQEGLPRFDVLKCIDELRKSDEYTYTHSLNVSIYAMLLGKCIKLNSSQIDHVMQAGLLHDIGKSKIPNEILNKPSRLTNDEFEVMKTHSVHSYRLLQDSTEIHEEVKRAVLMHHEKEDGKGYPLGASGEKLPLYARILAIADVYDALTSSRVYKPGMTPYQAFRIFENTGIGHFDYQMMTSFMYNIACFYINRNVELTNGKAGEVVFVSPQRISMPIIKIDEEFVDLSKFPELEIVRIF